MGLLDVFDLTAVWRRIKTFLGPVGKLIDKAGDALSKLITIVQRTSKLLDDGIAEFKAWRSFKQDVRLKSRVVNLEMAFEKTKALIEGIPEAWHSIIDIFRKFREQVPGRSVVPEAIETATELEEGSGEGLTALLEKFPKLAKLLEKSIGVLALVLQALESISEVVDDLESILQEVTRLRLEIEKLDTVFLSQSNKRKRLKLADGSTIRIRVGNIHQL